tara:strand:- start:124 stop:297 length:174 start_codon:yes stop_codon:yes gene_type:complete
MPDKVNSGIFKFDENVVCTTPLSPKKSTPKKDKGTKNQDKDQDKDQDTFIDNPFFFQ